MVIVGKSPKDRVVGLLPYMAMNMAYKWGWSDHHLLNAMILQVEPGYFCLAVTVYWKNMEVKLHLLWKEKNENMELATCG